MTAGRYCAGGGVENWAWHRHALSRFANSYVAAVTGLAVRDSTSGFRCYSRAAVELLVASPIRARGYSTLVELLVRCQQAGLRIVEVPIRFVDRVHGRSKMSSKEMFQGIASVVTLGSALRAERRTSPTGDGSPLT